MRPARRHGQRAASSPRVARARSSTSTRPARCSSCGSTSTSTTRASTPPHRDRRAARGAARPLLVYARDGDAALAAVTRPRAASRCRRSCGAPRWRTSSSTSPAAPWSTDWRSDVLTPSHRHRRADRLGAARRAAPWRFVYEYQLRVYRRTWRGSLIDRFLTPLSSSCCPWAWAWARSSNSSTGGIEVGGRPSRTCTSSCPASSPCRRCRRAIGESTYAGPRRDQVVRHLPRDARDARRASSTSCWATAPTSRHLVGLASAIFMVVAARVRRVRLVVGPAGACRWPC